MRLCEAINFNPTERLPKGTLAKKVAMDKLQPFTRDISVYEVEPYNGGAKFRNGDTIMARITPCLENGKTAFISFLDEDEVGYGSTEFIVWRAKEGTTTSDYIYYLSQSPQIRDIAVKSMVGSSGRQRVQQAVLDNYEIELPDVETQQKIGLTLRALDDKIANNTAINHKLEQMAQAVFKSWFVDFDPWGGVMPEDWQTVTLGDLCITVTKGTTPTTLKKPFVMQGINFVKAESILDDHSLDFSKLAFIDDETNVLLNRSVIQKNDIIFTIAGTLGRFAFVGADLLPANTNQAVAIIRTDTTKIKPVTLYSFFIGGLHSDFYTKNIQQAVQANLSLTTIKALPLLLPPKKTIAEYSTLIEPLFEQIFQNYVENRRLVALRDTLLPRLMSGELEVAI